MARARPGAERATGWGLFGGTFNPIHHGHLITAQHVADVRSLEKILFIPAGEPPHRSQPSASPDDRKTMVQLAIENHPWFELSEIEINRDGPSYTYDTIKELNEKHSEPSFTLILGADELISFTEWHRWQEILESITLVGVDRPGFDRDTIPSPVRDQSKLIQGPRIEMSGQNIRQRIRREQPIRYFVPNKVRNYIRSHHLYHE